MASWRAATSPSAGSRCIRRIATSPVSCGTSPQAQPTITANMSKSITACSQFGAGVADIFVMLLRCGGECSCDHYLFAVPFWRCFGLPLYSTIAREALAARLGLLPAWDIKSLPCRDGSNASMQSQSSALVVAMTFGTKTPASVLCLTGHRI